MRSVLACLLALQPYQPAIEVESAAFRRSAFECPDLAMLPFPSMMLSTSGTSVPVVPYLVATGTPDSTTATSVSPAYPAGIQANDILFYWVAARDLAGNATITAPAGWSTVNNLLHSQFYADTAVALFWKRATGSESGTETVNFSENLSSGSGYAVISCYRACVTSGNPFERATFNYHPAGTAMESKGLKTSGTNRRVITFMANPNISTTISGTNTNGWDEDFEGYNASGSGMGVSINSIAQATAARVEGLRRTVTTSAANLSVTLALVPIGGTPGSADPFDKVLLQLQFTGSNGSTTFTDESYYRHSVTAVGDAQIQSNKLELDGTGDYLTTSALSRHIWRLMNDELGASDNWTIDLFGVQADTIATTQNLISSWNAGGAVNERSWYLQITTAGNLRWGYSTGGTSETAFINYAAGMSAGPNYDIRMVRSIAAGEVYMFIGGSKVATLTVSAAVNFFLTAANLVIGAISVTGTPNPLNGRMAALRITRDALSTSSSYSVESLPLAA